MSNGEVTTLIADFAWALPRLTGNACAAFAAGQREISAEGDHVRVSTRADRSRAVFGPDGRHGLSGLHAVVVDWGGGDAGRISMFDRGFETCPFDNRSAPTSQAIGAAADALASSRAAMAKR